MAIYSLHHSSIGKATQAQPHTAAAHARYITRERAMSHVEAEGAKGGWRKATAFLVGHENRLRKNGRVADKLMLALPRELSADQRHDLVRDFARRITDGRAFWMAAHHDKGKDAHNPHCHLLVCDRDLETGRRVFGMSDKGSTERLRQLWESYANAALAKAGRAERIDHRSLGAQGVEREPTVHVGVRANLLVRGHGRVVSRARQLRNHVTARQRSRTVDYAPIDKGRSRFEFNLSVRRRGYERHMGESETDYWKALDEAAFTRDMRELRRIHAIQTFGPDGRDLRGSREDPLTKDLGLDMF